MRRSLASARLLKPSLPAWTTKQSGTRCSFRVSRHFWESPACIWKISMCGPRPRGFGAGRAMLEHLAQIAVERGWGRFEWAVLDWNEPSIGFYKKMGAKAMDEWTIFRMTGQALRKLAVGGERR